MQAPLPDNTSDGDEITRRSGETSRKNLLLREVVRRNLKAGLAGGGEGDVSLLRDIPLHLPSESLVAGELRKSKTKAF